MTFTSKPRFSFTAFVFATAAVAVLNGSVLMGFDQLASSGRDSIATNTSLAKSNAAPRAVTLERVVISTRRV